jgi:translocation and assembly module TamB
MRRASKILLGVVIALIVLIPAAVLVFTRTDAGRERTRRIVLGFLHDKILSEVKIGRIEGDLLGRFALVDLEIADQPGRPFLKAERITASIAKRSLFSKQILLTELALVRPVIRLSKPPDGPWNYQRIFASSDTVPGDTIPGFGDWVELRKVTLSDGSIIVQRPWSPDSTLTGTAADSAMQVALAGKSRARVERVSWGYQQTMEFTSIDALFPDIVVAHPDSTVSTLQIERLKMAAVPFNPPNTRVENVSGDVRIGEDTILVRMAELRLPGSRISGTVHYIVDPGDVLLSLKGDSVSLADLRLLYPPLPDSGGGALDLNAAIRYTAPSEYVVSNARLQVGTARVEGALGLVSAGDSMSFRDTDLRLINFPTSLVERLVPGVTVSTPGVLTGRAELDGPLTGMRVAIDATFDPERDAPFRVVARGGLGVGRDVSARQLDVRVDALPVTFLRNFSPTLPVGGTLFTEARLNGSTASRLGGRFTMTHRERGAVSRVSGEGTIAPRDAMRIDVGVRLQPVSLALATDFSPTTKLQGDVTGTARVRGPVRSPSLRLDLVLPTGTVVADGDLDFTQNTPAYTATIDMRGVDVHAIDPTLPVTTLNGVTTLSGIGTAPATMSARVSANFREIVVDSTQVQEAVLEAVARNGELQVDTLRVRTPFATADAGGTLGLVNGRDGKLVYRVDVQTIAGLARWISSGDTGLVSPRPGVRQRVAEVMAHADSVREAQLAASQDLAKLAAQIDNPTTPRRRAPPELPSLPRDSIGGALRVSGDVAGNLERFTVRGTATTEGLVWSGSAIGAGKADITYADARTPQATATVDAKVDSVRALGFAFDSTHAHVRYQNGEGDVDLTISPRDTSEYRIRAEYALRTGEGELRLQDLSLRIDTTTWHTTRPSTISWRGRGLEVDSLELTTIRGGGRIFVDGTLPDGSEGNLLVAVDSLRIAPWLRLLESDIKADALTTFRGRIEGTSASPRMSGTLAMANVNYGGSPFPDLRTAFGYDRQRLSLDGDLRRETGGELAHINGTLPLDLSLSGEVESRIIDAPFAFNVAGDSIPLAPFGEVTTAVTELNGRAAGSVSFRGTLRKPRVEGDLAVFVSRLGLAATGVTYTNLTTGLHMHGDSLLIDSLVARSGGTIRGNGSIQLATLAHPVFKIEVQAKDVRVLNNERGELFADAQLKIAGPLDTLSITGTTTITRGVVFIPDPESRGVISTGDLAILEVDSATASELNVAPPSTLLNNMNIDVNLSVAHGTWARSADANVEVFGDVRVRHDPVKNELSLTGSLLTEQGDYTYLGHRFVVTRGSARFTGDPTINPVLQVMANYEVRQAGRPPLEIRVVIAGTLQQPRLTLESNARPALSQSDLISFLAFGTSSSALLTSAGSGVSGGGQTGASLAGNVAALATRQLTGVALGAMMEQVRATVIDATRADVVNITPAELPADLSVGGVGSILKGTEVQVGKYVDRRTFLMAQVRPTNALPGATVERRLGASVRVRASFETRFQPVIPSLSSGVSLRTLQVMGGLVTWSLKW